jgi:hypothetical protein
MNNKTKRNLLMFSEGTLLNNKLMIKPQVRLLNPTDIPLNKKYLGILPCPKAGKITENKRTSESE